MARKRMITPSFWTDEKIGECSMLERLLFLGLISNADDEGIGRANPKLLKSLVFPYDDLRISDFEKSLDKLASLFLIKLYLHDGQQYYLVTNFKKHQTINRPTPSDLPKPPKASDTNALTKKESSTPHTLTEHSLNAHATLTPNIREVNIREVKLREEKTRAREVPFAKIQESFNSLCPSLSKILGIKGKRKTLVSARWKENPSMDYFKNYFRQVENTKFLLGQNNRNWKATFDWLMNDANMTKVNEGIYKNVEADKDNSDLQHEIESMQESMQRLREINLNRKGETG